MKIRLRRTAFAILIVAAFVFCSCSHSRQPEHTVVRLRDGAIISFSQMLGELKGVDFIFVGEIHDSMKSHELQLQIIKGLHNRKFPLAVGLEMFWAKSQPELDQWIDNDMNEMDFIRLYYRNWQIPWPYYRDIFLYLRKAGIPMVGLNIPWAISQKVATHGADALSENDLGDLPPGLSCDVSIGYKDYIRQVFAAHTMEGHTSFQNFCEAQVLWDKVMAWHLVRYEKKNPTSMVVLSGLIHALKRGIPSQIEKLQKKPTIRVIVPEAPGIDMQAITPKLADYLIFD